MKKIFLCIITFIIILITINWKKILKQVYKTSYSNYVEQYSEENGVDPLMVYAIIKAESNFNEGATSRKGALGLMQLMDNTAKEVAENSTVDYVSGETLYNPEKNIMLGIKYYSTLKTELKNDGLALAAYNAGIGNVKIWIETGILKNDGSNIENIPYKETNMYVRKILKDYKIYKALYENKQTEK
ncbi:MAG: lytic transglycosylase domain-containing protein [Mollicutes bacterium]|nr:lytic transglycosylase domain-containing protein [Mollicutes bacterium]